MSSSRSLSRAISAIEDGNLEEAALLLNFMLQDDDLPNSMRAVVYITLARTTSDRREQLKCYADALDADPNNEIAQRGFLALNQSTRPTPPTVQRDEAELTATQTPPRLHEPPPTPTRRRTAPPPPPNLPQSQPGIPAPQEAATANYRIVGVLDGPNGPGTGFFITRGGIIVTTRHVVGGEARLSIELEADHRIEGRVMRSFPEMDIAFVHVSQSVNDLMPFSSMPGIDDDMQLQGVAYGSRVVRGAKRMTNRALAPHWFPTNIVDLPDEGGIPVFDDRRFLVGMLTKNISNNAAYVFGVHIGAIERCLNLLTEEMRTEANRIYCPNCGHVSQAGGSNAPYCEYCGGKLNPKQTQRQIFNPAVAHFYNENAPMICNNPQCRARVGLHKGRCLRCGADNNRQRTI